MPASQDLQESCRLPTVLEAKRFHVQRHVMYVQVHVHRSSSSTYIPVNDT